MPLYHYECTNCGRRVEVLQNMGEETLDEEYPCANPNPSSSLCHMHKRMTQASFKFIAGTCEGWGGWERGGHDGESMIRQIPGTKDGRKVEKPKKEFESTVSVPRKVTDDT